MNVVFFGSDHFSLPALKALHDGPWDVSLVVTAPPAPCGRGRQLTPSPVALLAGEMGLPVLPAKKLGDAATLAAIGEARPGLLAVAAYGGFLPPGLLRLCPSPPLNVHPSLLPRWRGPAPVNWTLINGDGEAGVSIIFLTEKMDAGPILAQAKVPVTPGEGAGALEARLAETGASLLAEEMAKVGRGEARPRPQDESAATRGRLLRKEDGRLDFTRPARELAALVNGVDPWPGAQTTLGGQPLKAFGGFYVGAAGPLEPGRVRGLDAGGRLAVETGDGLLLLAGLQPAGKKRLAAADFWRGYKPGALGR